MSAGELSAESWVVVFECARGTRTLAARLGQEHGTLYTTNVLERVARWPSAAAAEGWLAGMGAFGRGETLHCGGLDIRAFAIAVTADELADLRLDGHPFHGPLPCGVEYYPAAAVTPPFEPTDRPASPPPAPARPKCAAEPDWPGHIWRETPGDQLIRYCPGSSVGRPRWGSRRQVDRWRRADDRYLEVTMPFSARSRGPGPHEGPCPAWCPRWSETSPPRPARLLCPVPASEPAPPPPRPAWLDRPRATRSPSAPVASRSQGAFSFEEEPCTAP